MSTSPPPSSRLPDLRSGSATRPTPWPGRPVSSTASFRRHRWAPASAAPAAAASRSSPATSRVSLPEPVPRASASTIISIPGTETSSKAWPPTANAQAPEDAEGARAGYAGFLKNCGPAPSTLQVIVEDRLVEGNAGSQLPIRRDYPLLRGEPAVLPQRIQEVLVGVERAARVQPGKRRRVLDDVQVDAAHRWIVDLSLVDQARDQMNGPDLADQTGVKRNLAKALLDL